MAEALGRRRLVSSAELAELPGHVAGILADVDPVGRVAAEIAGAERLVTVARGYLLAAARETALKLRETSGILAEGWSGADLLHGPIAAVKADVPVLSLRVDGPAAAHTQHLEHELEARGATVLRMADRSDADLALPVGVPETLASIGAVVRGQQLARLLSLRVGIRPGLAAWAGQGDADLGIIDIPIRVARGTRCTAPLNALLS